MQQIGLIMKIIQKILGDQLIAKYSNTKFYIKQFAILSIKSIFVLICSIIFFLVLFLILTPDPTNINLRPVFEVKKSSQNNMITIYTNKQFKKDFCHNQSAVYYGKLYSKQQFCQFQHQNLPFQITNHNSIDVSLLGLNKNVQFVTACIVKVHQDRSVCQKFAYSQNLRIFNNLNFQDLYSIQIELDLKVGNQYFGDVLIKFQQQNSFFVKILKQYYYFVSIISSIIMALILTFSFAVYQIPQILQKGQQQQKKVKQA